MAEFKYVRKFGRASLQCWGPCVGYFREQNLKPFSISKTFEEQIFYLLWAYASASRVQERGTIYLGNCEGEGENPALFEAQYLPNGGS